MHRRSFSLALSSALILAMTLASAGPAHAASSKAKEKAERARVVKYWTPKRMARAIPRDFVKRNGKLVPAKKGGNKPDKPGSGSGGGGGDGETTTVITGASWTGGGPALEATGKVFFTMGGTNYVCSGAAVVEPTAKERSDYSLVLTAGHCVFDETNGAFAENWMFAPAYDTSPSGCYAAPHGCFVATALVVHDGYASAGGFNSQAIGHDWGFAVVGAGSKGGQLDREVAAFPIDFGAADVARTSFGYPAQGQYDGRDLVYCEGPVITDGSYGTWGLECDMTPGSSGGPWMTGFSSSTKSGTLNSVNSYKYNGGPKRAYMFGPKFGSETRATYNAAVAAASDTTVD
jgi:V8-like Glu-specific endopeptidase